MTSQRPTELRTARADDGTGTMGLNPRCSCDGTRAETTLLMSIVLLGLMLFASSSNVFAETITVPPRLQANRPKPKIYWDFPTFRLTYGKTFNLCPTVVPGSLGDKIDWTSQTTGALEAIPSANPSCTGVFLPVKALIETVCDADANLIPKLHGIPAGLARAQIIRPARTQATALVYGPCTIPSGGGLSLWELAIQSTDAGTPEFDGLPILEDLNPSGDACNLQLETDPNPGQIGPPVAASNAIRDRNSYCVSGSFPKNCTSVFKQTWKVGKCTTSPVDITFAFDTVGNMTLTRQDGNKAVGPFAPGQ